MHAATITGLKGRWQKLRDVPLTICDTGHNADGIREVVAQISATPHRRLHFVIGMVKEKDASTILKQLPADAMYYFCQASIPRALPAELLASTAASFGLAGTIVPDVNEAIRQATTNAANDDLVFIGGSTFVVAEIDGL
jgi:dihydrofolate synthase/folylpolyglutamate synthase